MPRVPQASAPYVKSVPQVHQKRDKVVSLTKSFLFYENKVSCFEFNFELFAGTHQGWIWPNRPDKCIFRQKDVEKLKNHQLSKFKTVEIDTRNGIKKSFQVLDLPEMFK